MKNSIIERVDNELEKYKSEHQGNAPLYIQVSTFESEDLRSAIRANENVEKQAVVTTYKGSKVVENFALKKGELTVGDELPESGS